MLTITRANWGNVTVAQYRAINLLKNPDVEHVLDTYWDRAHENNVFADPGSSPVRLSESGREWLYALQKVALETDDENVEIDCGRQFLTVIGTLVVMGI